MRFVPNTWLSALRDILEQVLPRLIFRRKFHWMKGRAAHTLQLITESAEITTQASMALRTLCLSTNARSSCTSGLQGNCLSPKGGSPWMGASPWHELPLLCREGSSGGTEGAVASGVQVRPGSPAPAHGVCALQGSKAPLKGSAFFIHKSFSWRSSFIKNDFYLSKGSTL